MTTHSPHAELGRVEVTKRTAHASGPSKKTQLIKLLSRKSGADVEAISAKFGWQPHTTRAALSGLCGADFGIAIESAGTGKPTRYWIVNAPSAAAAGEITDGQ